MSRCKLRTPSPIHFKLRTVIGIDSLSWFLKKCVVCINVPIHVYGAAVGEILIFHSRVMGKKVFTNIVWMFTMGVSCALGAAVYYLLCKFITHLNWYIILNWRPCLEISIWWPVNIITEILLLFLVDKFFNIILPETWHLHGFAIHTLFVLREIIHLCW